jgi:hypothetical protein
MGLKRDRLEKRKNLDIAKSRRVFAVRRRLDPVSYPVFESVSEKLEKFVTLENDGNLSKIPTLSTTMLGFSRFTSEHINSGPATSEWLPKVESTKKPLQAKLGKLALFGIEGDRRKLAFELSSPDIIDEISNFEDVVKGYGFDLQDAIGDADDKVRPHLSVGFLYRDSATKYTPQRLQYLDDLLSVQEKKVTFLPVRLPDTPRE